MRSVTNVISGSNASAMLPEIYLTRFNEIKHKRIIESSFEVFHVTLRIIFCTKDGKTNAASCIWAV